MDNSIKVKHIKKLTKTEKENLIKIHFPEYFKLTQELKASLEFIEEDLQEKLDKIEEIHDKLDELEELKSDLD